MGGERHALARLSVGVFGPEEVESRLADGSGTRSDAVTSASMWASWSASDARLPVTPFGGRHHACRLARRRWCSATVAMTPGWFSAFTIASRELATSQPTSTSRVTLTAAASGTASSARRPPLTVVDSGACGRP